MAEAEAVEQLREEPARLVGLQLAPLVQVPQHVAFAAALHHEEVALRRGDPREEADDVLVLQPLVVLHLPL